MFQLHADRSGMYGGTLTTALPPWKMAILPSSAMKCPVGSTEMAPSATLAAARATTSAVIAPAAPSRPDVKRSGRIRSVSHGVKSTSCLRNSAHGRTIRRADKRRRLRTKTRARSPCLIVRPPVPQPPSTPSRSPQSPAQTRLRTVEGRVQSCAVVGEQCGDSGVGATHVRAGEQRAANTHQRRERSIRRPTVDKPRNAAAHAPRSSGDGDGRHTIPQHERVHDIDAEARGGPS